jgi:hypothetical protein
MTEDSKKGIIKLLEKAENEKFFGEVAFRFRDGELYLVFKSESIKPEDLMNY